MHTATTTTMRTAGFAPLLAPLGFYPVLPDAQWVQWVLHWGARTVQLRVKTANETPDAIAKQVHAAVQAGRAVPGAQVFINDHWKLALEANAYGVHLGQEDWVALNDEERTLLRSSGMRLGLSTHTPQELAIAHAAQPSYIAIGPVYPTTLKVMPYEPVGLAQLKAWVALAKPYPVVAIGGISLERLGAVVACGINGVAAVSAITRATDPRAALVTGLQHMKR